QPRQGGRAGRRPAGGAGRGGARARARQGGGRHRLRPGLRVTARAVVALAAALAAAAPARAQEGGERATLAQLEQRSRAFYALLEHGERERAAATWPGLEADLARFRDGLQGRLDRMRDEVIERDGDLEELFRSPRFREPEVMSLVAAYHLAWVRYHGALLTGDAAKKKALLQKAVEGFSQFLLVNEVSEIYADSLYGRGLAFLELGDTAKAIEDLSAAAETPQVGAKARAALEEARRRASGRKAPAEEDPEALLAHLGELVPRAAGGDAAAEKQATALARGLAARAGPWPARVASLVAEKLGGGTPAGVHSTYGLFLLAQLAVDRGRCDDVPPFAEASEAVHDAARARLRPEILYLDAGCRLNTGQARAAAERFATLLREFPVSGHARDAAYYRARGDCKRAEAEYGAVGSGPFAARARLGGLECRVVSLGKGSEGRTEVLAALRTFVRDASDKGLGARAALLGAVVAAGATPPDQGAVVALLDGFEKHYPDAQELHPRALELRLAARVATGQLAEAARDLEAFLALRTDAAGRRGLVRGARRAGDAARRGRAEGAGVRAAARGPRPRHQRRRRPAGGAAARDGAARVPVTFAAARSLYGDDEAFGLAGLDVLDRDAGFAVGAGRVDEVAGRGGVGGD